MLMFLNVILLLMLWSVFFSLKYADNLSMGSWVSKTTLASGWDKSKANAVSFYKDSRIIQVHDKENEDEETDQEYFSKLEDEDNNK